MTKTRSTRLMTVLLAAWTGLLACGFGAPRAVLSTSFLARGEKALLQVAVPGSRPGAYPKIPIVEGVMISPTGQRPYPRPIPGRRLEYIYEFSVSSYDIGDHVIPPFEVKSGTRTVYTEALDFAVFNPDDLVWSSVRIGSNTVRYASAFRVLRNRPYIGQAVPVEIKLYLPRDLSVKDWGIPDVVREGVNAWRFQPSPLRGNVNLLGMPYVSVAYPSTLTPNRTGTVSIGPAKIRLITTQVVMRGIFDRISTESHIEVPALELESLPLPPGAPEGFDNAIGTFRIQVTSETTEVEEGDPIAVDITVSGSGNLDTLRPPQPADASGWKLYDTTREQRGDERRGLTGSVVFHQFMRPLELQPEIPPFRFVYFDPDRKSYHTALSPPIPLDMTPATPKPGLASSPPPALPMPVERMTDILGIINNGQLLTPPASRLPAWIAHALAAITSLSLVAKALWMRHGHKFKKDPVARARAADLRALSSANPDDRDFLIAAGSFIERWLANSTDESVRDVLGERDRRCFVKDAPSSGFLGNARRKEILRILRKASPLWLALFLLTSGGNHARASDLATDAIAAYNSARYDEAISLWLDAGPYETLSADTLYNIGNACYRLGSPGYAALYYHRALTRDPGHPESMQNLRFLERKYGAITVHRPEYQDALAHVPLSIWKSSTWAGLWTTLIAALVFPASRPGARIRVAATVALIAAPLAAASGALGWHYYPDDSKFSPIEKQVVVIAEEAVLHTDAARTSPEIIDAPPGSVAEVIQISGRWAYVAFATKTRGWIPVGKIRHILPEEPPTVPKIEKPKATEKSA